MYINAWVVFSQQALSEYKAYKTSIENDEEYAGTMDAKTFLILNTLSGGEKVQKLFKTADIGGTQYTLFSLYQNGTLRLKAALDYLEEKWPSHFHVLGVWWMDGRQVGTQFTYLEEERINDEGESYLHREISGVTGTPLYQIPANAYLVMPDRVLRDEDGSEISRTPATSNADLRDINLRPSQAKRRFS